MIKTILILFLLLAQSSPSQWSTSNKTQDAIFACPGFYSEIVTYPDGSSIVIGIGGNNEIWMQKFDPFGYKQWLPYVTVFPAQSGLRTFLPDDDGGLYAIVGTKAQRVDKHGNLSWGANGKIIIPSGSITKAVTDGKSGFIALYNSFDGSKQRVTVFRYDSSGTKLWESQIDSGETENSVFGEMTGRLGEKTLVHTSRGEYKFVDLIGGLSNGDSTLLKSNVFIVESEHVGYIIEFILTTIDSQGYRTYKDRVKKLSNNWEADWSIEITFKDTKGYKQYLNVGTPFLADGTGGIYFFSSHIDSAGVFHTRIQRITKNGLVYQDEGIILDSIAGRHFFSTNNKLGFVADNFFAQSLDTSGIVQWPYYFSVINDFNNTNALKVVTDNNGGGILSFWTIGGGIKVQHTGRNGKVGVITKIRDLSNTLPKTFELFQNYPNPFNNGTVIKYSLAKRTSVAIKVFDILGKEVKRVFSGEQDEGSYAVQIEMNNYPSGIYFYRLDYGGNSVTKKMLLLK